MRSNSKPLPELSPADIKRFQSKVMVTDGDNDCWEFQSAPDNRGYRRFFINRSGYKAHRIAYLIENGPFNKGLDVMHICDNPACCRPSHLMLGTHLDNMNDMLHKGRDGCLRSKKVLFFGDDHWTNKKPSLVARGERQGSAKLTEDAVRDILQSTLSARALGRKYGVPHVTIRRVQKRQTWKHIN